MRRAIVVLVVLAVLATGGAALAVSLGEAVIKAATVGVVVNAIAGPADKAINTLTLNRKVPTGTATKVVPAFSVGEKGYVGAVQVAGSQALVNKTKAVLQYETSFSNKQYRIKLLLPMDSVNPLDTGRVRGLGASALVDVALSSNSYLLPRSVGWNTGDALKAAAIGVAVTKFGPQLDSFLDSTFKAQHATPEGVTKVVPYLSVGEKAYIGLMQVAGPAARVAKVKAVWQYEDLFDRGRVRLRVLVPSDTLNPLKIKRVKGVGCVAVIDAMVLRAQEHKRRPGDYRYFERSGLFVGPGEDPHYRPPGWDRGRKTGWTSDVPPGQEKRRSGGIIIGDDHGRERSDNHAREQARERNRDQERNREQERARHGKGKGRR